MTLKLAPGVLARAYDYLRETDPFKGWKLPASCGVVFQVVSRDDIYAEFEVVEGVPTIRVSAAKNGHSTTLLASVAHEMIHLRQHLLKDREVHGPRYQRMAKRICDVHGFDLKIF